MANVLKKTDLVRTLMKDCDFSNKNASLAVDKIFEVIEKSLIAGDSVQVYQFGKFLVSQRSSRVGVNPSTGEKINIPAAKAVRFQASVALKDKVNKKSVKKKKK